MPATKATKNHLRELREAADLTQEALAQKAKVSFFTISRLENGHHKATKRVRLALAKALGADVDEVFPRPERKAS